MNVLRGILFPALRILVWAVIAVALAVLAFGAGGGGGGGTGVAGGGDPTAPST